jgi:hypothetical protein
MPDLIASAKDFRTDKSLATQDRILLFLSLVLQLLLGLFFGHAYDMRIFMATGYLVGTGQNPYIVPDLSAVFHNASFQGVTSLGYPPPWTLVLGSIYLVTYRIIPNFLLYNLAIKLPVIAANIGLAYLVAHILRASGVPEKASRRAWLFMLFNPFILCASSAWGQIDPVAALLALLCLFLLSKGKTTAPAILLALAVSCKPTAMPIIPVAFVYLAGRSPKRTLYYFAVFTASMVIFCVAPFIIFGWDPAVILQHWNFHFAVGGGMSFMTFFESLKQSYQLTGSWQITGWLWAPALGIATYLLRGGIGGLTDLLKKSLALILVFYLFSSWVSEPNLLLVLPLVLILTCMGELRSLSLTAVWALPLIFGFFNTSLIQLLFPSMPGTMQALLNLAVEYNPARFALRTVVVIAWLATGWWIAASCFRKSPLPVVEKAPG